MLKSNELRIGNIITRKGWLPTDNKFYETIVSHNDITACFISPETFKPIPLTEDILLKCGFELNIAFYELNKIAIGNGGKLYFNSWKIMDAPKYLHQLQNLYFALTNTELTIKL